eukprot:jgi/Botrbrau1/7522/Bobra.0019s0013.3
MPSIMEKYSGVYCRSIPLILGSVCLGMMITLESVKGENEQGNPGTSGSPVLENSFFGCPTNSALRFVRSADRGMVSSGTALGLEATYERVLDFPARSQLGLKFDSQELSLFGSLPLQAQLACVEAVHSTDTVQLAKNVLAPRSQMAAQYNQSSWNEEDRQQAPSGPLVPRDRMEALGPLLNISSAASADVDYVNGTQPRHITQRWRNTVFANM